MNLRHDYDVAIRAQNINSDFLNLEDIAFVRPPASAEGLKVCRLVDCVCGGYITEFC